VKKARLNRLFSADTGGCFDVAIDHGSLNEPSFLNGIEGLGSAIKTLTRAAPDAMQLTIGQEHHLQSLPKSRKPALVLRTDVANVYGPDLPRTLFSSILEEACLQAVRIDAACVVVNLFRIRGQPEVADQCIQKTLRLKPQSDFYGLPLMIEPLVFQPSAKASGCLVDGDPGKIIPLVRHAVELGANIIKADPSDDKTIYHKVVETAGGIPVPVRGGGKASEIEILSRTEALVGQGDSGIVYGRNIIHHLNPAGITRALMAVVHEGVSAEMAFSLIRESRP
jgi:fructose-bisphosphate aldolase, class I